MKLRQLTSILCSLRVYIELIDPLYLTHFRVRLNERRRFREDEALYHGAHYTAPLNDDQALDSLVFDTDNW